VTGGWGNGLEEHLCGPNDDQSEPEKATLEPLPCPRCGRAVEPYDCGVYSVACSNCYDGAPDAGPQLYGTGRTAAAAVNDWNERVLDAAEEAS